MTTQEFEILACSLRPRLLKVAGQISGSSDEAQDIVQDTMLRLWSMRDDLGEYRSVEALAVLIAKRLALTAVRDSHHTDRCCLSEADAAGEEQPDDALISRQRTQYIDSVMASLPDTQQILLRLRHIEGYDNATIARLLNTSEGAVRTALSRARRRVAQVFNINILYK